MTSVQPRHDLAPLRLWERAVAALFVLMLIAFGVIVEIRCVHMENRQTDLGVYLRAAWAVRVGENPYTIEDENRWHYCYPPVVALLLTPLADPPAGADAAGMLPWAVLVVVWYLLSLAALFLAVHWIAGALEARSDDPAVRAMPAFCRRWWYHRALPVFVCVIQIGSTLSRGQVNLFVILCVAGMFAALTKGKRLRSGLWLGAAICLKVIPAFLLLFPLWRRDYRALVGVAIALGAGLFVLPALYWGVPQTIDLSHQFVDAVLVSGLGKGGDQARAKELTEVTATDNQSFRATLHNYQHWGRLSSRPPQPAAWARLTHWLISGFIVAALLAAAGWKPDDDPVRCLMLLGALFLLMTLVTPVSHLHYFSMAVPLVMALNAASLKVRPRALLPGWAMLILLVLAGLGYALPTIPIWEVRREAGLPAGVSLILFAVSITYLLRQRWRALTESTAQKANASPEAQGLAA
jgi:hypothetical protein